MSQKIITNTARVAALIYFIVLISLAAWYFVLNTPNTTYSVNVITDSVNGRVTAITVCTRTAPLNCITTFSNEIFSGGYNKLVKLLNSLQPSDKIILKFKGEGGDSDAMFQLIRAIKTSHGDVTTSAVGYVYSAHAYLSVAGKHIILKPGYDMLFHRSQCGNHICAKTASE